MVKFSPILFNIKIKESRSDQTTGSDFYTQPVGFVKPATLQAPLAGPDGYNS